MSHSMETLLGISLDFDGFPCILPQKDRELANYRYSLSAYSLGYYYASSLKNCKPLVHKCLTDRLYEGKNKGYSTLLCSFGREMNALDESEAPPYSWKYNSRVWTMICRLKLNDQFKQTLSRRPLLNFAPIGSSHGEYILCRLLEEVHAKNFSSLAEFDWSALRDFFEKIAQHGRMQIILSDGQDLVAYHSGPQEEPFFMFRSAPPHEPNLMRFQKLSVKLDANDLNRTLLLFTNQKNHHADLVSIQPGQMLVARNGSLIWDSHQILLKAQKDEFEYQIEEEEFHPITAENPLVLSEIFQMPLAPSSQTASQINLTSYSGSPTPTLYSVYHKTHYHYDAPVHMSKHLLRLQPLHDMMQNVVRYKLTINTNGKASNFSGVFGNHATTIDITDSYEDLIFTSYSLVILNEPPRQRYELLHQQWTFPLIWMPWDRIMLQAYLTPPELAETELYELSEYAMTFVKRNNNSVIDVINDINHTIFHEYTYESGSTTLSTTPYHVYYTRRGVCQDFANLFICLARLLNIPARYRVGYIFTGTDYDNKEQGDATHAWVELYLPNVGWLGFDPTNNCVQGHNHIRVACGRNFRDAAPTAGTIYRGGGEETLHTTVQVVRLSHDEFYQRFKDGL